MKKPNLIDTLIIGALVLITACVIMTARAYALVPCTNREAVVERLTTVYGEMQVATGIAANGSAFEVFVSPSGTWTVFTSSGEGSACMLASGTDWSRFGIVPEDPEAH
ncbi:hypothetical protein [Tropicimonas sp. S265A]|uniref:hypothetical protein n=1 Tax=Tropicimonas sp. S265A TaxID=3415134 RepID=UPI003C7ECD6D